MKFTLERLTKLFNEIDFCSDSLRFSKLNLEVLPVDRPDIQESVKNIIVKLKNLDGEAETVFKLMNLDPRICKEYFGGTDTRKSNLFFDEEKAVLSEIVEKLILFSGVKMGILQKLILEIENKGNPSISVGAGTAEIPEQQSVLPLCVRPGEGIYRSGSNKLVLEFSHTRRYLFLEACIEVYDPDFKVHSEDIYRYLVKNKTRLPARYSKIQGKTPEAAWVYVQGSFYDLCDHLSTTKDFLVQGGYSNKWFKWIIPE